MRSGQNRSSAVMQRRSEPHDSLDDFPTPPWATRALCVWLEHKGFILSNLNARDPAANRGYMVDPMAEFFRSVEGSDIFDYGAGFPVSDYLFGPVQKKIDFTITNPPFRLAHQFIVRSLVTSNYGAAMLVRSAFLEGIERYETLFKKSPPNHILQFCERVVIHKGIIREPGSEYWDPNHDNGEGEEKGKMKRASSATAYSWLVWDLQSDNRGTQYHWLPKCRHLLEKPGDYDKR